MTRVGGEVKLPFPQAEQVVFAQNATDALVVAEAIGRGLKVPVLSIAPEKATEHFGFLGGFVGLDMRASSALTQGAWDGIRLDRAYWPI